MSKLILMRGLPASGKSTIAQGRLLADGNAIRINKDLLRKMLHFNKFSGINEKNTRGASRTLARTFLRQKMNVIIDDTNLNPGVMESWKALANEEGATVEIIDMTDIPVEECVMRDIGRNDSVGGVVIKNMALQYGIKVPDKDSVVLVDIDGTIADTSHRLHFVKKPEGAPDDWKKDWNGFFSQMENDPVREDVRKIIIQLYNEGKTIIFMSGRPEQYRDITLNWLSSNFLTFAYTVIMRPRGDKRPDIETKRDLLNKYFPDKSVIHMVLDDRPSVIRVWKDMGLTVLDCGKGEEF